MKLNSCYNPCDVSLCWAEVSGFGSLFLVYFAQKSTRLKLSKAAQLQPNLKSQKVLRLGRVKDLAKAVRLPYCILFSLPDVVCRLPQKP